MFFMSMCYAIFLLHSDGPKLQRTLTFLSARELMQKCIRALSLMANIFTEWFTRRLENEAKNDLQTNTSSIIQYIK